MINSVADLFMFMCVSVSLLWGVVFLLQGYDPLTLKAPITTAADDIHKYFFIVFQRKSDLMFQVNPLLGRGFT